MIGDNHDLKLNWKKMKNGDIPAVEKILRNAEKDYVSACGKYLMRNVSNDPVWLLCDKKENIYALIINSRSTLIPVLKGINELASLKFLKGFLRIKKIHSVQGLKEEVIVLENTLKQIGWKTSETIDYDLMSLDKKPDNKIKISNANPLNLILRVPKMTDLDALSPLQAAYEKEEVLPKGSVFSPAASRVNIANIVAGGKILAALYNGKLVGKINVSAVSFTRYLVGGVYVHPDFRGMGIARKMAYEFINELINEREGRGVTLFVKKNNIAAKKLYTGLGFITHGDYRIAYY
ncbi:MAG: GNAT family N-acetyltransferase [Treponema sp.]|nr:GNAT family N-acetyltransferase [Treponema sp.]